MLKVQHIGIPTKDIESTISWYNKQGFNAVFRTTLKNNVHVAFIKVCEVLLEFYQDTVNEKCVSNIDKIVINSLTLKNEIVGPNSEKLLFVLSNNEGLNRLELNTDSISQTSKSLILHGFTKVDDLMVNGDVKFKLNEVKDCHINKGFIDHIAFNEPHVLAKSKAIVQLDIPIIEGINFLPFFDNGVIYFVTKNYNGLKLEYNQII